MMLKKTHFFGSFVKRNSSCFQEQAPIKSKRTEKKVFKAMSLLITSDKIYFKP